MKPTFDEARERLEGTSGTEYIYGAIAKDLAAVPKEHRVRYAPEGVVQFNNLMDTNGCASRSPCAVCKEKFSYFYHTTMHPSLKVWLAGPHKVDGKLYSYIVGEGAEARVVFDETFIEILSGTTPTGNSLKAPIHAIHEHGLIPECLPLEDGMTWEQYMNPKRITPDMRKLAAEFNRRFGINYEQVPLAQFYEANEDDAFCVAGHAWDTVKDGIYQRTNKPFNHAFPRMTNVIEVIDSYEPFLKRLARDYAFFEWGYSLSITRQTPYPDETMAVFESLNATGLLAYFTDAIKRLWDAAFPSPAILQLVPAVGPVVPVAPLPAALVPQESNREKLNEEALLAVGRDVSPADLANDDLACAESACNVIRHVYHDFPILLSTAQLYDFLKKDKRFKATLDFKPGNIIISPTGTGTGHGHVGICTDDERITSNTSKNGKWENNYSLKSWVRYFRTGKGMRISYFEPL